MDKKELVLIALHNYYCAKANDFVYGREHSEDYSYRKGYLIGVLTAFCLDWRESDNKAIITYQNSGRTFATLDLNSYLKKWLEEGGKVLFRKKE